jgi:hypothetical protein
MMMDLDKKIEYGITLRPTMKEFSDFRKYVFDLFVKKEFENSGAIKVV